MKKKKFKIFSFFKKNAYILIILFAIYNSVFFIYAEQNTASPPQPLCATITTEAQEIEYFSLELKALPSMEENKIPCNTWIWFKKGFLKIKHHLGAELTFYSESFFQLLDDQNKENHITLTKGSLLIKNIQTKKKFQVLTPIARVNLSNGQAILIHDDKSYITQIIALQESATIENRYQPENTVTLQACEQSKVEYSVDRALPSPPTALNIPSLKKMLENFRISTEEAKKIIPIAEKRATKKAFQPISKKKSTTKTPTQPPPAVNEGPSPNSDYFLNRHLDPSEIYEADELIYPGTSATQKRSLLLEVEEQRPNKKKSSKKEKEALANDIEQLKEEFSQPKNNQK